MRGSPDVSEDPFARLEHELITAARRRAAPRPAAEIVSWPRARRRRIRVGDALSAAAVGGAVLIVALAALALLGWRW